jgi:hypothetical protein
VGHDLTGDVDFHGLEHRLQQPIVEEPRRAISLLVATPFKLTE